MSDPALAAPAGEARLDSRKLQGSPCLSRLRLNPFRVLRLPVETGVDEAIWRAEEALTLDRAGLSLAVPDVLPWLAPPDDQEIRQAVQCIEEPLRRLLEQLCWFDFRDDPAANLLQEALARADVDGLSRYLAGAEAGAPVAVRVNHANVSLLLAALALAEVLPASADVVLWRPPSDHTALAQAEVLPASGRGAGAAGGNGPAAPARRWKDVKGLRLTRDPHEAANVVAEQQLQQTTALWRDALGRWSDLLKAADFLDHLKAWLARLGDELNREEDAETLLGSLSTRLTDLLVAEVKVQLLAGRPDRVQALLSVAADAGGIEPRQWMLALRSLRPLFRTEITDLEGLLGTAETPRLDDVDLFLNRLGTVSERWTEMDPTGLLGLDEFIDDALARVNGLLSSHLEYGAAERISGLLERAAETARAGSVKQRITATLNRLRAQANWLCHYCREREAEPRYSVTLKGRKETGRVRRGNTITIYYAVKWDLVRRCPRCTDLHEYLFTVGRWMWLGLVAFFGIFMLVNWRKGNLPDDNPILAIVVTAGFVLLSYWIVRPLARRIAALVVTPRREHKYWEISTAPGYKTLRGEGYYEIRKNYSRGAFDAAVAATK
jgi:hypothetical protein